MICCTFLGNGCVQSALLFYGSHLVLHEGMPMQVRFLNVFHRFFIISPSSFLAWLTFGLIFG